MSTPSPERLAGRYQLLRVIGSGGMGQVWLAQDELLDRNVAIKQLLHPHPDAEAVARAMREARLAGRLTHPNAVGVFNVVVVDEQPYLVMEFVPGQTLGDLLERRPTLEPGQIAPIIAQIARALAAAHRLGIVHRDVKPGNILLTPDGVAKLADFGVARGEGNVARAEFGVARGEGNVELTRTGAIVGSLAYLAPEQATGAGATPASDIWALGATLFRALEGRYVVEASDSISMLGGLLTRPLPPPMRAGPLHGVLSAMLDRDPTRRPTAQQVADALDVRPAAPAAPVAFVDAPAEPGRPPGSPPGTPFAPGPSRRQARRILAGAVAVAVLAAAALTAVLLTRGSDNRPVAQTTARSSAAPNPAGPVAPVNAGCTPFLFRIEWTWSPATTGDPAVSYAFVEDDHEYSTTLAKFTTYESDSRAHDVQIFAVAADGTRSPTPLKISCSAGTSDVHEYVTDTSGDGKSSTFGREDVDQFDWTWGSLGLDVDLLFVKPANADNASVTLSFDADRNPKTGFAGIDCAHSDAAVMGVEYAFVATPNSLRRVTYDSSCHPTYRAVKGTVSAATSDGFTIDIDRSEFTGQVGQAHMVVTTAAITDARTGAATPALDVVPNVGKAPVLLTCQP